MRTMQTTVRRLAIAALVTLVAPASAGAADLFCEVYRLDDQRRGSMFDPAFASFYLREEAGGARLRMIAGATSEQLNKVADGGIVHGVLYVNRDHSSALVLNHSRAVPGVRSFRLGQQGRHLMTGACGPVQ
jgi:hypothetical protein